MSWYVLRCRMGQEKAILDSCKRRLSSYALEDAFIFQCRRLWKSGGVWKPVYRDMFPGYVFLESSHPGALSGELDEYRGFLSVMEDGGYLISLYEEEEINLRELCGRRHLLEMSYGFKDREKRISYITEGPLKRRRDQIVRIDWHRRFAQLEVQLARQRGIVWAGLDLAEDALPDAAGEDSSLSLLSLGPIRLGEEI